MWECTDTAFVGEFTHEILVIFWSVVGVCSSELTVFSWVCLPNELLVMFWSIVEVYGSVLRFMVEFTQGQVGA